jgi:hypothetical protein
MFHVEHSSSDEFQKRNLKDHAGRLEWTGQPSLESVPDGEMFHVEQKISTPHPRKPLETGGKTGVPQVLHRRRHFCTARPHCHQTNLSIPFFLRR